ncbi:MAG TPA: AraC family transcriptional regulator [Myxococcus sp.]|nr:AraC family transcriptional regulator [Myxococcus sp.]
MALGAGARFEGFLRGELPAWVGAYGEGPRSPPGMTSHAYAVVALITRGSVRMRHRGDVVLRTGDVHLIPPGDSHGLMDFQGAQGLGLGFHPDALRLEARGAGPLLAPFAQVRGGCHPVFSAPPMTRRRLLWLMRWIQAELAESSTGHERAVAALVELVLIEVSRLASVAPSQGERPTLARKALALIEKHALEPLTLSDVAAALKRSPAHLAHIMKQETGRSVGAWVLERRMAEARRRLRATDERVDAIATRVGYADVTHFIRQFRRAHGMTPSAWRKAQTR